MAQQRPVDWQSFPLEFREHQQYPSLQESAATAGKGKRRVGSKDRIPNAILAINRPLAPVNYWNNKRTTHPSVPEWTDDDVNAANQAMDDPSFSAAVIEPEQELVTVEPKFTDNIIAKSRLNTEGYSAVAKAIKAELLWRDKDPTAPYRSTAISVKEGQVHNEYWLKTAPNPRATPKWTLNLPDNVLNSEFKLLSYTRPLGVPLGPRALEEITRRSPYRPINSRELPLYKVEVKPSVPVPSKAQSPRKNQPPRVSHAEKTWTGPSNDVRLSGASASSSQYDAFSKYGRQNKQSDTLEFVNSRFKSMEFRDSSSSVASNENASTRNKYERQIREWDACYENPSNQSNRYDDYDRHEQYGRRDHRDYDYKEDSGYHGDYDGGFGKRSVSPAATSIDTMRTGYGRQTPARNCEYGGEESGRSRSRKNESWTDPKPSLEELKEREAEAERINKNPDSRKLWNFPEVSTDVRKALRCLEGISANSSTTFFDDMQRVELSTWSGEEDAEAAATRLRDKFGLGEMERESRERRVMLALPRTSITLSVGAGGEAEILFDGDCTDVLVREKAFKDVQVAITENVLKTRDFRSHNAIFHLPSTSDNTVITFATAEESRAARERLKENGIDARKIPRDLITGNWDGSYAKRECLLELEWERHGTHGYSVRFTNLREQSNLVDRVMREKSDYFMGSHVNMEEYYNRMYISVPHSPYPIEDDVKFLKNLFDQNGVDVHNITQLKGKDGPQTIDSAIKREKCTFAINRRMLKVAIEEGVWGGFHPRTVQEWQMMLDENRFSWVVEMPDESTLDWNKINSATVHFDSYEQGERIATQVQRMTPNPAGEDRFILNREDRKGVFARAKLRVHYNVPVLVHALTVIRLKKLDDIWRTQSHFNHADFQTEQEPFVQWTCLITDEKETTPPGFSRLIVEGFPRSAVEDSCAQLMAVLKGDVIKCDGDEGWLLTGIGRNMANAVAKEALEKDSVLVDFNVLGKEIRLIGERFHTVDVERRLRSIARIREAHVMKTLVSICQPIYMNRAIDAVKHCGGLEMIEKVVGECQVRIHDEDVDKRTLRFHGTVRAYERFRDFLGDLDDTLRHSAKIIFERERRSNPLLDDPSLSPLTSALLCPICSCRPSPDFYRLEACGHVYCTACIYHQLHSELSSRTLPLACRRAGCECKLAVSDLLRLLLGRDPEENVQAASVEHLDEIKLRPLVTAIVSNALQTKRDRLIACRTADCAGIFPRVKEQNSLVRCKTCERTTCGACGYEPHRGFSCEEYESLRDNVDVSIASYMKNKKVRKCPNGSCSAVIEKTVGCNHMECVICRTHFCWLCGHSSHTQGEIYAHMQNEHGGNGLHMDDGELFMLQFDD